MGIGDKTFGKAHGWDDEIAVPAVTVSLTFYVLTESYPHSHDAVTGVYSTLERAKEAAARLCSDSRHRVARWLDDGDVVIGRTEYRIQDEWHRSDNDFEIRAFVLDGADGPPPSVIDGDE